MADAWAALLAGEAFEWDEHNAPKIWRKHRVGPKESEEVFFNRPLVAAEDWEHSQVESRYYALGQTDGGRRLFVVFTVRGNKIRVISARDMSRQERRVYESHEEANSEVQE